jgi:molecular chaperone GrpE
MSPGDKNNENNEMENNIPEEELLDDISSEESGNTEDYDKLKANFSELNNRFLRLAADFDNYKKRVSKEKTELSLYANEEIVRELLTVLDNLNLAIDHANPEGDINSTIQGVKLVYNLFLSTLDKFGLSAIESSKGTNFDPRRHQALERIETEEITPGLILDEMIRGYMFKDRLLRPASVTVSTDIIDMKKNPTSEENVEDESENEEVIEIKKDSVNNSEDNVFDLTDEENE